MRATNGGVKGIESAITLPKSTLQYTYRSLVRSERRAFIYESSISTFFLFLNKSNMNGCITTIIPVAKIAIIAQERLRNLYKQVILSSRREAAAQKPKFIEEDR